MNLSVAVVCGLNPAMWATGRMCFGYTNVLLFVFIYIMYAINDQKIVLVSNYPDKSKIITLQSSPSIVSNWLVIGVQFLWTPVVHRTHIQLTLEISVLRGIYSQNFTFKTSEHKFEAENNMGTRIKESKSGNKTSTVIFSVLKEFAEKTSMDGLRFIANEEASIGER